MNPTKRDALIDKLTVGLKPVRVGPTAMATSIALGVAAIALAIAGLLLFFGHRDEMPVGFASNLFWINEFGSFACVMALAYGLSLMSLPGRDTKAVNFFALASIIVLPLTLFTLAFAHGGLEKSASASELGCTWRLLLISIPAAVLAVFVAKRGAPPRLFSFAVFSSLLAVSVGEFVLPLVCENSSATHMIVFHLFVPLLIAVPLSAVFVLRQIRW